MKKLFSILAMFSILFIACAPSHKDKKKYAKVHSFKQRNVDTNGNDFFLYWYLIYGSNGSSYNYYSSPTPINDFSSVNWAASTTNPVTAMDGNNVEEMPTEVISSDNLSQEMQQEFDSTPENFEGMTADEMGDYEGGETNTSESFSDADGGSSGAVSDGGESDSGSDSGGGDSGGGDGGGGGE